MLSQQIFDPPPTIECSDLDGSPTWEGQMEGRNQKFGIVISVISAGFQIDPLAVLSPTRRKAQVALSRQVSMYLAHVSLGMSLTEVGRGFDRDRTTVAHACQLIEDLRDEPEFDFALDHLEGAALKLALFCDQS